MDQTTRQRIAQLAAQHSAQPQQPAGAPRATDAFVWGAPREPEPPTGGHFTRGLRHGLRSLDATISGAAGLAAHAAGADGLADAAVGRYSNIMEQIAAESSPAYNVGNWESIGDPFTAGRYWAGYGLSQLAFGLGGGAIGGAVARRGTRELVRRQTDRRMQTPAMQDAIRRRVDTRATGTRAAAGDIATTQARREVAQDLTQRYSRAGFLGGTAAATFPQTLGSAFGEAVQYADEQGLSRQDVDTGRVVAGGLAAGAVGTAETLLLGGAARIGPLRGPIDALTGAGASRARRMAARGTAAATAAAGTEALQEQLIHYGAGREGIAPRDQLLTAAFAGGVLGGPLGAIGGIAQPPPATESPASPAATPEERVIERLDRAPPIEDPAVAERVARDRERAAERAQQQAERERIIREAPPRAAPDVNIARPDGVSEAAWQTIPRLTGPIGDVIQTLFETTGFGKRVTREGPARDIDLNQRGRAVLNAWRDAQVKAAETAGIRRPEGVAKQAWRSMIGDVAGESNPFAVRARASRVKGMTRGPKLETFMQQWESPEAVQTVQDDAAASAVIQTEAPRQTLSASSVYEATLPSGNTFRAAMVVQRDADGNRVSSQWVPFEGDDPQAAVAAFVDGETPQVPPQSPEAAQLLSQLNQAIQRSRDPEAPVDASMGNLFEGQFRRLTPEEVGQTEQAQQIEAAAETASTESDVSPRTATGAPIQQPGATDVIKRAQQFDRDNPQYVRDLEAAIEVELNRLDNLPDTDLAGEVETLTPPDEKAPLSTSDNPAAPSTQTRGESLPAMGTRVDLTPGARGNNWEAADGKRLSTAAPVRGLFFALGGITDNHLPSKLPGRDSWLRAGQQIGHADTWAPGVVALANDIHATLKALDQNAKDVAKILDGKTLDSLGIADPEQYAAYQTQLNRQLADQFGQLEALVGRRNLLMMQRMTKSLISSKVMESSDIFELFDDVSTRGLKAIRRRGARQAGKELPPQIRFSRALRDYRMGRTTSELMAPRALRDMNERMDSGVNRQINRIFLGKSLPVQNRTDNPTQNVLQYYAINASQPWQRAVVRLISRAFDAQGLKEPGVLRWNAPRGRRGPNGELATFAPDPSGVGGTITIWQDGANSSVVLHEMIHAATVNALNTLSGNRSVRASMRDAVRIAEQLSGELDRRGADDIVSTYGENTRVVLEALKSVAEQGDDVVTASEMLSYGLTDEGLQQLMLDTRLRQPRAKSKLGALWQRFVDVITALLKGSISDPTRADNIEPFLTTSARIFSQISANNNVLRRPSENTRDALAAMGALPPRPSGKFNAAAMSQQSKFAREAAAAEANAESTETNTRAAEDALRRKEAAEQAETLQRRKQDEVKQTVAAEEIMASTAIEAPDAATRDVLLIDRIGRGAFDAVLSMVTNGKHTDFEATVNNLRQASATKFLQYLASDFRGPNGEMTNAERFRRLVNYSASSVLNALGTDATFRSFRFQTMNADRTRGFALGDLVNVLQSMNAEESAGLLAYLENPTTAQLEAVSADPEIRSGIRMLAGALEEAFADAKRLRLIDSRFDAEGLTILDFVRLNDKDSFRKNVNAAVGKLTPNFNAPNHGPYRMLDPIMPLDVLSKDGSIKKDVKRGDRFKLAREMDSGRVVAVDPAITHKTLQDRGLTYHNTELDNVFTVRQIRKKSVGNEMASIMLGKLLTADELAARNMESTVVASLATAAHDWSRAAEFSRFRERMEAYNNTLPVESRWILDAPPDDVPSDRVLDAPQRLSDTRPVFADALRLPGNWVRVSETARGMWEPLRGKYVAAPVFSSLADMYNTSPHIQSPTMRKVMGVWKKHMTVWSPITWQHNIAGNLAFSYFHDIPARNIKLGTKLITHQMMPNIAKKYLPPLTKKEQAILDEIKAAGIELVSFKHQDIDRDSLDSLRNLTVELNKAGDSSSIRDLTAVNTILQGIFSAYVKTDAAFSDFYSNQDNVFRAAAYITYLENAQARKEPVTETLLAQAGQYAREAFVDYQIDAPFINAIRFGKLGGVALPFIAWTYRATGIMAKTAMTKPWKIAAVYGAVSAINAMAYGFLGADEEEERAILPEYMSRNVWGLPGAPRYMRLPFGDGDRAVHMNLSSAIPLANVFEAADYGNLPGTLMPGGPTMIAIEAIFNYQFFRQQPITTEMDMFTAQHGKDFLTFATRSLGPRMLVDGFATGNDILVQRQGPTGSDPSRWIQLARVLGFNFRESDMFDARYYQSLDVQRIQRETAAAQNRLARDYFRRGVEPNWDRFYEESLRLAERGEQRILDRLGIED